jgi:hypothetical protein
LIPPRPSPANACDCRQRADAWGDTDSVHGKDPTTEEQRRQADQSRAGTSTAIGIDQSTLRNIPAPG